MNFVIKATTIKEVVVLLVTNRRFVQMRILLQEVVQLGIRAELPYKPIGSTVDRYFGIAMIRFLVLVTYILVNGFFGDGDLKFTQWSFAYEGFLHHDQIIVKLIFCST